MRIIKKSQLSRARRLRLDLYHGSLETPFFMPDATRAVLKNTGSGELKLLALRSMVVNTLHLYLQPGVRTIKKAGGLNRFMGFPGPLLSDSGGFQIYSLIHNSRSKRPLGLISDEGAFFSSPIDGSKHSLTPESSVNIQLDLGTDMIVALDDCPANESAPKDIKKSVDRTISWALRARKEFDIQAKKRKLKEKSRPLFFAVIQGGLLKEERKRCAEALLEIGFDGLGFGARPVDEKGGFIADILSYTADLIPDGHLRFGLGIGLPGDIAKCAAMGWDMFDCVIPTREGRHGRLFFEKDQAGCLSKEIYGSININNSRFKEDFSAINEKSAVFDLRNHSKSYLYHLFKIKDPLGPKLASLNNLEFYLNFTAKIRQGIQEDKF